MGLRFVAKNLHLVLVETLIRAELQLRHPVLEVDVADGVAHVPAPVARFGPLERGPPALRETRLRTEDGALGGAGDAAGLVGWDAPAAPAADGFCGGKEKQ